MAVELGIVIVHYNTPQDLERCLASISADAPACSHAVVVVDNASTAPGVAEVRDRFPACTWLLNEDNRGYARGCNQGLAAVAADYYLLLNPDVVVLPGALDALVALAHARPRAGIIGPQLLNEDGTVQESCRRFYTFGTLLLRRTPLGRLFPRSSIVERHLMRDFDHASERAVDWLLGGCLLVRAEALVRCGPMDERFFLYFEDVDWCYRMWRCGFEVIYTPAARFVHRHRRSSARGPLSRGFWLHLTSMVSFYEKWGLLVYLLKKWRQPLDRLALWALDMLALTVAFLSAYGLRQLLQSFFAEPLFPLAWYRGFFLYTALFVTVAFLLQGRYSVARVARPTGAGPFARQMGLVALLLLASSYLGRDELVSRAALVTFLALFAILAWGSERVLHRLRRRMVRGHFSLERTLFVGDPTEIDAWLARSRPLRADGIDAVGYATVTDGPHPALGAGDIPWLGPARDLPALVERLRASQVVFWAQPAALAAADADLGRLLRRRIRLRWRVDESWLLAARARLEAFGAEPSGVLEPDDGLTAARLGHRGAGLVAGLALALLSLPAHLWQRAVAVPRGRVRRERVDCRTAWGDNLSLIYVCDPDGRVRPLWQQWGLALALVRGQVYLVGQRLHPAAMAARPPTASVFWQAPADRPGLTGAWQAGRRRAWSGLWRDPGGLGTVTTPVVEEGSGR